MLHVISTIEKQEKEGVFDVYIADFKKAFGSTNQFKIEPCVET